MATDEEKDAARAARAKRLEEIAEEQADEAEELEAKVADLRIARHDLKKKMEKDANGVEGIDFAIVAHGTRLFVVKKPDFVVYKKFMAIPAKDTQPEHVQQFVGACIMYPSKEEFDRVVVQERNFTFSQRCMDSVFLLMRGDVQEHQAK
jgi:hypothetical protein